VTHGVLKLTLHPASYDWEFVPIAGQAFTDTGTASCVSPGNNPPLANDDSANTSEDTTVAIDVTANDSDPDTNLDATSANSACNNGSVGCVGADKGSLTDLGDGTIIYSPNPGSSGSDGFVYEICDVTGLCDVAVVHITVNPSAPVTFKVRVADGYDDAEENSLGRVSLTSSDLEMTLEKTEQTVGLRFNGVAIPQGATIVSAYIQFQVDETNSEATALTIQGQAADNAPIFDNLTDNISSRPRTVAVEWTPVPWTSKGEAGPDQQTADLAPVIQEIVDRGGWASGNSLVIIITGSGKRVAESFNGDQAGAPLLHVEYVE
jgi:hypothetical protein